VQSDRRKCVGDERGRRKQCLSDRNKRFVVVVVVVL
jgi:hypothetical protein